MSIISISTDQFVKTVEAEIDGVRFKVRKLGAGDTLDVSQVMGQIESLQAEVVKIKEGIDKNGEDAKSLAEANKVVAKMAGFSEQLIDIYARLFDDGEDGSKSKALVRKIGTENVQKLLDQIFEGVDG